MAKKREAKQVPRPLDAVEAVRNTREMDPAQRIVIQLPLEELFDSKGAVRGTRVEPLSRSAISGLLASGVRRFVVANVGEPLRWISREDGFSFWTRDAQDHVADPAQRVFLDDYRGGFAFFAWRWRLEDGEDGIVLEMQH